MDHLCAHQETESPPTGSMAGRWTKAVVERVEKEVEKQKKVWCVKFGDTDFPEEEVAHEDDGEMALPEGGKFPKEVCFIDSATLDPWVLGRVVLKKVNKPKVQVLLRDEQVRVSAGGTERFQHHAHRVASTKGVAEASELATVALT